LVVRKIAPELEAQIPAALKASDRTEDVREVKMSIKTAPA